MNFKSETAAAAGINVVNKGRKITCSEDVYDVLLQSWNENKTGITPGVKLVLLNKEDQVIGINHRLANLAATLE